MSDDWAARKAILSLGEQYVVQRDAPAFPGVGFKAGERAVLRHVGYSRYDGAYVYQFEVDGGASKAFLLSDSDPSTKLTEAFARYLAT